MQKFKLKQEATCVPAKNVKGIAKVELLEPHIVLIQLKDFWIRLNLDELTFAIGDYEG